MSLEFRIRDWLRPPIKIVREAGVHAGMTVLDFGCGPGGFSLAAAHLVGPEGRVFAVDINPLALRSVQRSAARQGLNNIQMVLGGSLADVPAGEVDTILLYDVLHDLPEPGLVLAELSRVLKPEGDLSVSDHHLKEASLLLMVTDSGLFSPIQNDRRICQFGKNKIAGAKS
jgi:ubiquinone/menaquinone biosynthesis C-methylase UbiE